VIKILQDSVVTQTVLGAVNLLYCKRAKKYESW